MTLDRRRSGVLLHPTALPSRFGIGDFGPAAFDFLDYLSKARQSLWQVLPLGPTGFGDSPYASPSAFAGNVLMIAPDALIAQGLLSEDDVACLAELPADHVDFGRLPSLKHQTLQTAFGRGREALRPSLESFRQTNAEWLADYALFSALKDELDSPWTEWDSPLRERDPAALAAARERLIDRVEYHEFCQLLFFEQWIAVRERARALGIAIMGDIAIFVAHDSADVWAHQRMFKLDDQGRPLVVAGVPPDYFSATGQLWGNPLYDWDAMASDGYAWWIDRFRHLLALVDVVRIDHFRGFEAAWEVPADAESAAGGKWVSGPGDAVFKAITDALGGQPPPVVAEDLGLITDEVRALLKATGFPGMKVLQFAFGDDGETPYLNPYLPHNYPDPNCVVYTGTHDNNTTRGWLSSLSKVERAYLTSYLGEGRPHTSQELMRLALGSTANTVIVPLQDVLDLGSEARVNRPGAREGNWSWRVLSEQLDADRAGFLAGMTLIYGRAL